MYVQLAYLSIVHFRRKISRESCDLFREIASSLSFQKNSNVTFETFIASGEYNLLKRVTRRYTIIDSTCLSKFVLNSYTIWTERNNARCEISRPVATLSTKPPRITRNEKIIKNRVFNDPNLKFFIEFRRLGTSAYNANEFTARTPKHRYRRGGKRKKRKSPRHATNKFARNKKGTNTRYLYKLLEWSTEARWPITIPNMNSARVVAERKKKKNSRKKQRET